MKRPLFRHALNSIRSIGRVARVSGIRPDSEKPKSGDVKYNKQNLDNATFFGDLRNI